MVSSNPTCGCGEDAICNETELKCDPCCRCVPQRLCATFESYGCDCDGSSAFLPLDSDGQYSGQLICGPEIADLAVLLHSENQKCYWRVVSEKSYIDELFEIGPELQSCERPDLILPFSFAECGGTLRIKRHDLIQLPPRLDDAGCPSEPFCGNCKCTCKCLCVTIRPVFANAVFGELCDNSGDDPVSPHWAGNIGDYALSFSLERDYSGNCILLSTVNGETVEVDVSGDCADLQAAFELYSGTVVEVACKSCRCNPLLPGDCARNGCETSLGNNPTLLLTSQNRAGFIARVPMYFTEDINEPKIDCPLPVPARPCPGWKGEYTGLFYLPQGGTYWDTAYYVLICGHNRCSGFCFYGRYASDIPSPIDPLSPWRLFAFVTLSCECPQVIGTALMTGGFGYQDVIIIVGDPSECE